MKNLGLIAVMVAMTGCTSVGSMGMLARRTAGIDVQEMLKTGHPYKEIGLAQGRSCRHFLFALIPWGNADIQSAVDDALAKSGGGDALINVTTANSMYGFIPIYSIYTVSCTTVKGTAIRFQQ